MFTKHLVSIFLVLVLTFSFSMSALAQEDTPNKAEPDNPLIEWLEGQNWFDFNAKAPILFQLNRQLSQKGEREFSLEELGSQIQFMIKNALAEARNQNKSAVAPRPSWFERIQEYVTHLAHQSRTALAGARQVDTR